MNKRIIECVPNFSEGRDKEKIQQIVRTIEAAGGVKVPPTAPWSPSWASRKPW